MLTKGFKPGSSTHKTMVEKFAKADPAYVPLFPSLSSPPFPFQHSNADVRSSLRLSFHSAFSASAKIVAGWPFDRIIPCHGEVIETGGKEAWASTYANVLK